MSSWMVLGIAVAMFLVGMVQLSIFWIFLRRAERDIALLKRCKAGKASPHDIYDLLHGGVEWRNEAEVLGDNLRRREIESALYPASKEDSDG